MLIGKRMFLQEILPVLGLPKNLQLKSFQIALDYLEGYYSSLKIKKSLELYFVNFYDKNSLEKNSPKVVDMIKTFLWRIYGIFSMSIGAAKRKGGIVWL